MFVDKIKGDVKNGSFYRTANERIQHGKILFFKWTDSGSNRWIYGTWIGNYKMSGERWSKGNRA